MQIMIHGEIQQKKMEVVIIKLIMIVGEVKKKQIIIVQIVGEIIIVEQIIHGEIVIPVHQLI